MRGLNFLVVKNPLPAYNVLEFMPAVRWREIGENKNMEQPGTRQELRAKE